MVLYNKPLVPKQIVFELTIVALGKMMISSKVLLIDKYKNVFKIGE